MNELKKLLTIEIELTTSRYNCCVDILNGLSANKASKKYNVGTPLKTLRRWCKVSNEAAYNKTNNHTIKELRDIKHLFIGGGEK